MSKSVWERIEESRARHNVLEHPFYVRWSAGELERVGVVVVHRLPLVEGEALAVAVVRVEPQQGQLGLADQAGIQGLPGGLAGAAKEGVRRGPEQHVVLQLRGHVPLVDDAALGRGNLLPPHLLPAAQRLFLVAQRYVHAATVAQRHGKVQLVAIRLEDVQRLLHRVHFGLDALRQPHQ